uniref:GATOR2 complex protein WDR24 n=1 Tax=Parastrongyloides trichosuri TaxID=131310 RepID=A0A0N4ZMY2_PARTI
MIDSDMMMNDDITINSNNSDNEELAIEATEDMCDERYSSYKKIIKQNTDSIDTMCTNFDCTKIAVGGKEGLLKVYDFNEENGFNLWKDVKNRRNYKMSMFNTISLSWNKVDDNLLASIVSTGTIAVFDLNNNYTDRWFASTSTSTATKICFNDYDKNILLSGYTDSNCCLIDLRAEGIVAVYNGSYSPVRDVKFNTNPDLSHNFIAVDDNGMITIWDMRKTNKPLKTVPAHQGTINNIAIHPFNKNLFATAGIDRYIRLWEEKNTLKCLAKIETMFPVFRLAFNPNVNSMWKIASSYNSNSLGIVHVWDFERPSLPLLSLNEHTNTITDIVWPSIKKGTLLTAGKDKLIVRHNLDDGKHIMKHVNLNGLAISPFDDIAVSIMHMKEQLSLPSKSEAKLGDIKTVNILKNMLPRVHDKKGSVYIDNVFDKYDPRLSSITLIECAEKYKMSYDSQFSACHFNSQICTDVGDHDTAELWLRMEMFLKFFTTSTSSGFDDFVDSIKTLTISAENFSCCPTSDDSDKDTDNGTLKILTDSDDEVSILKSNNDSDNESVDEMYTKYGLDIDIELIKIYKNDIKMREQVLVEENPFYELDDTELIEAYRDEKLKKNIWDVQSIKQEIFDVYDPSLLVNDENRDCININKILKERVYEELGMEKPPNEEEIVIDNSRREAKINNFFNNFDSKMNLCHNSKPDSTNVVRNIIYSQVEMGRLQFVCTVILIMGEYAETVVCRRHIEKWFLCYIELLRRYQLFEISAYFINKCPIDCVREMSLQSTSYRLACKTCKNAPIDGRSCDNCKEFIDYKCRVCEGYVQGSFVACPQIYSMS